MRRLLEVDALSRVFSSADRGPHLADAPLSGLALESVDFEPFDVLDPVPV